MARFLHTSDWHLGRTLHGTALLEHQEAFLDWLLAEAVRREVDAVLVAGDVYDRAVPPSDAVRLLDRALAGFARAGVAVVVSSGNHDSAVRLGFGASLASAAQVYLRTRLRDLTEPVLFAGGVGVYAIPYLLPDAVMAELGSDRSHAGVLTAALARIRGDAAARGLARTVVLAHAFVTGGAPSDSERDISVGGIGDVPAAIFTGVDYVALGHLHGAQQVAPGVRYSGSPLPFSFSERNHHKSVAVVEVDAEGVRVELVPTPVPHPMHELRGTLTELLALAPGPPADSWLKVVLTDVQRPAAPMEQLRERWPNTVILDHRPAVELGSAADDLARLRQVTDPVEVCSLFVEWVDSTLPSSRQRDELASVVEAVRHTERSA